MSTLEWVGFQLATGKMRPFPPDHDRQGDGDVNDDAKIGGS
ncbi:hypothetical protein [Actinoplanes flavus]|nr:hypothetical protein [Actinoplanes flavus]